MHLPRDSAQDSSESQPEHQLVKNPFEVGIRKVIPAVLVYVRRAGKTLMIHRNSAGSGSGRVDFHSGKWNGLGGKCELNESPLEAAQRELKEESGLDLDQSLFRPLGVIQFPNFKAHRCEDWIVFVFVVTIPSSYVECEPSQVCGEGELHWISDSDVESLNLWPGDCHFLPYVMTNRSFIGTIWYEDMKVVRYWVQEM